MLACFERMKSNGMISQNVVIENSDFGDVMNMGAMECYRSE